MVAIDVAKPRGKRCCGLFGTYDGGRRGISTAYRIASSGGKAIKNVSALRVPPLIDFVCGRFGQRWSEGESDRGSYNKKQKKSND